ncbi:MAG: hypothetical protein J6X55_14175 [Victivallales bacterium]|nr:hypothetical protein [Victivallales bacterium]
MNFYLTGGTECFRRFISAICGTNGKLYIYDTPEEMPEDDCDAVYLLLPCYESGKHSLPELSLEKTEAFLSLLRNGGSFYFENVLAKDNLRRRLTGMQAMGNFRYLFKECIVYGEMILQAREAYHFPSRNCIQPETCAVISDCIGTHSIFRQGNTNFPVLNIRENGRCVSAMMNISQFDARFMRPYSCWRRLFADVFSRLTCSSAEVVEKAFDEAFPEFIRTSGNADAEYAVRKALAWHEKSGMLRKADGTMGIYEMIQSNGLELRMNLRTDSTLLTGAFFAAAGKKYQDEHMSNLGRNLVNFLVERHVQLPNGLFKWMDHTNLTWSSDSGRDGLAIINMYKATGDRKYLQMAKRLGDAFLDWLGDEAICCGYFEYPDSFEGKQRFDNPVFYGEMVSFLLQLPDEKYHELALRNVERVGRNFPDVSQFGYSDNFTYARYFIALACAQYALNQDYSERINHILDFFENLQEECGGIRECPIRLKKNDTEAGIAIGDGSDAIADIMYCVNFVFISLSVLGKLPANRIHTINMDKVKTMYQKIRSFLLRIQIVSPFAKLDGGWMRAYDMQLDEYYGLDLDMDWGAYCIMGGWVMSFIPLVFLYEGTSDSFFVHNR